MMVLTVIDNFPNLKFGPLSQLWRSSRVQVATMAVVYLVTHSPRLAVNLAECWIQVEVFPPRSRPHQPLSSDIVKQILSLKETK